MKPTPAKHRAAQGMTLLELTVVIVVILSLISILFIGAKAWKSGADQSGCILNIRNVQNAVRAHQNLKGLDEGAPLNMNIDIVAPGKFIEMDPECPGAGNYTYITYIPNLGELAMPCSLATSDYHVPKSYADW